MKKRILLIAMMSMTLLSYAQEKKPQADNSKKVADVMGMISGSEVVMDIDEALYPISQGTSHFAEGEKAGIVSMIVPASFEKMKEDLEKQKSKQGVEILDRGVKEIGGREMLFLKQRIDREGVPYLNQIFCERNTEESTIIITSFCEESKEKIYEESVNKAVISARLKG
ncbi:MAG: hypothetical protein ACI9Y7_002398 [Dokdonia sp.]|jgi:hypothetical protein